MYLKRLEMQGFKSFVDKTVLEFGSGITAIVGPNGSGKSNISDAVRWVLGEQSTKILRGSRMEDMIFSGTENRRSVGFAEVSLIMDNSDHVLHIDYEEVKVTRRLFRSGESEYQINGAVCRLKDIYLLFADTGIGKDGYSIISQGRVDEILSNKSEERRNIFEDASGIMKYRMRKQESERKLAATEQNLLRINDIISELEYQIGPLAKQSETAKKYLQLKYELRDIEVGVLVDGIGRASQRLSEINQKYDDTTAGIADRENALQREKTANENKSELSRQLDAQLQEAREKGFEIERNIERLHASVKLNEEKISSVRENMLRLNNESHTFSGRKAELESRMAETQNELKEAETLRDAAVTDIQEAQNKYDSVMALLSDDSAKAEALRDSLVSDKLAAEQRRGEIEALRSQISVLEKNKEALMNNQSLLDTEWADAETALRNAVTAQQDTAENLDRARQDHAEALTSLTELKTLTEQYEQQLSLLTSELKSKEARLKLLQEMEANYEGYARSVKEVLSLCRKNPDFGSGIYGAVAQLITVPQKYEAAVEAALGSSYQNLVTASEEQAKQAISYLKEKKLGRATFMPVTAVAPREMPFQTVTRLKGIRGYLGIASDLITYDSAASPVIRNLLGKVAVFETLDSAVEAAKLFRYEFICVTIDGDILRTTGAITGGSPENGRRSGTISRTREIPALKKEVSALREQHTSLWEKVGKNKAVIFQSELEQGDKLQNVRALEIAFAERNSETENLKGRLLDLEQRRGVLSEDFTRQSERINAAEVEIEDVTAVIQEIETRIQTNTELLETFEEKAKTGAAVRNALSGEITELKLKAGTVYSRIEKLNADKDRFAEEVQSLISRFEYMNTQLEDGQEQIRTLQASNEEIRGQIDRYLAEKTGSEDALSRLSGEKQNVDADLAGMMARITGITDEISLLKEELGRLEIRRMKAEGEVEYNTNRLWEEYELTPVKAKELTGSEPVENYAACQKRISLLKNEIKQLGPVNISAIEELESTQNRYTFLSEQRNDMEDAKVKLKRIISEVDHLMKEQFSAKFKEIRQNFMDVFRELFGGGKADIILTDSDNVLESGIEIHVQPPGKKLQNMMLLSGGERALTAIALLFGILRMHPSPFCLLDEIEAALDEANVYRFSTFLNSISRDTQFILVTHRKGTMEAAHSLYGVTMEEKGVSRVLSMRLEK